MGKCRRESWSPALAEEGGAQTCRYNRRRRRSELLCVDSAIRGAYERDYKITFVSDAHSTGDTCAASAKNLVAIQIQIMQDLSKVVPAEKVT